MSEVKIISSFEYAITKFMVENNYSNEDLNFIRPLTKAEEMKRREDRLRETLSRIKVRT